MLSQVRTIFFFCLLASCANAGDGGDQAAAGLTAELKGVTYVSIYMLSRTEQYDYSPDMLKKQASLAIIRRCGGNCDRLFLPVINHLRGATRSNCQKGQQDILIEVGAATRVFYSHSGRSIEFAGRCYFTRRSVAKVIKDIDFIFD